MSQTSFQKNTPFITNILKLLKWISIFKNKTNQTVLMVNLLCHLFTTRFVFLLYALFILINLRTFVIFDSLRKLFTPIFLTIFEINRNILQIGFFLTRIIKGLAVICELIGMTCHHLSLFLKFLFFKLLLLKLILRQTLSKTNIHAINSLSYILMLLLQT